MKLLRTLWCCLITGWFANPALAAGITPQTLTWAGAGNPVLALNTAHPLSATASSGLPVTLRVEFGPAALVNGLLTVAGQGLVQVTAEQAGGDAYAPARETRSFNYQQVDFVRRGKFAGVGGSGVQVAGNYAYLTALEAGLMVIDLSNPTNLVRRGTYNTSGYAQDLFVDGNYAYVADGDSGLQIIDISNPASPRRAGGFNTPGFSTRVEVAGNFAYVVDGTSGIQVIDISNPASPARVGLIDSGSDARAVQVAGNLAYTADLGGGFQIFGVSDPSRPNRLGGGARVSAWSLAVTGKLALVAGGLQGLTIYDVSDPAKPVQLAQYRSDRFYTGVEVVGNIAYVRTQTFLFPSGAADPNLSGLDVFDISNPANPVLTVRNNLGFFNGLQVEGHLAYAASYAAGGGLDIFDIRLGNPQLLNWPGSNHAIIPLNTPHSLNATASSGLPLNYTLSGPASIENGILTATNYGTITVTVEQAGDAAFIGVRETRMYNERQAMLTLQATQPTANLTYGIDVAGNYAYMADWGAGLQVLDVSRPNQPVRLSLFNTPGQCYGVHVVDHLAYVADGTAGLQVLDLSDRANPVRLGGLDTSGNANAVEVVGNRAYVADGASGLQIIDVTDPAAPVRLGGFNTPGDARKVKISGNTAYVADGPPGVIMIDVTNPASPVRIGSFGSQAADLDIVHNLTYLASGAGLVVMNVSNPANPVQISFTSVFAPGLGGSAESVRVVGGMAFVAAGSSGLQVFDVSNPAAPVRLGSLDTPGQANGVRVAGNYVYVSDFNAGMQIFEARIGYPQTLAWTGTGDPILPLNTSFPAGATASSGLPVTYRVSGPATLANGSLTVTGRGTVSVIAEQAGDTAYLPARGTRSFNVAQAQLSLLNRVVFPTEVADLQIAGQYAYVVERGVTSDGLSFTGGGLRVFDLSRPEDPVRVGTFNSDGGPQAVQIEGHIAYLAGGTAGLRVIDVSNPAHPVLLGEIDTGGQVVRLQVTGNRAYLADGSAGLQIVDISDPANPARLGGLDTTGFAYDVKVVGNYAFVADAQSGLQVIDVTNPASPVRVNGVPTSSSVSSVEVAGSHLYVPDFRAGLQVFDIANPPSLPRVNGTNQFTGINSLNTAGNIAFAGGYPLRVFDISNPAEPLLIGTNVISDGVKSVQVLGDVAYVASSSGFRIFGLRFGYPQSFTWSGAAGLVPALDTPYPVGVTASSGLPVTTQVVFGPATLVNGTLTVTGPGLVQVAAEQPGSADYLPAREIRNFNARQAQLSPVATLATDGDARVVRVAGNRAYVGDQGSFDGDSWSNRAFRIVDISNPTSPVQLGAFEIEGRIEGVRVVGNFAYVADYGEDAGNGFEAGGLRVLDISNPAAPVLAGQLSTDSLEDVEVAGNLAYVVDWAGLRVLDISNPANPSLVGGLISGGYPYNLDVAGSLVFVAASTAGLEVIDVSKPGAPVLLGSVITRDCRDVHVAGNYAYVADSSEGLLVIDVSNPSAPAKVGNLPLSGSPQTIRVSGNLAYVAAWNGGLQLLDVTNPANPVLLAKTEAGNTLGVASGVDAAGNYAFIAAGFAGLQVVALHIRSPQPLRLELAARVPFPGKPISNPVTTPSGLPLSVVVLNGPASIVDQQLVLTGLGAVTLHVEQAGSDLYLPASAEWKLTVLPPTPSLRLSGQKVELAWPSDLAGLKLQHRESFHSHQPWQEVAPSVVEANGAVRASLESTAPAGFFRLLSP